jgi:hypothetical protein
MPNIRGRFLSLDLLKPSQIDTMYGLLSLHFDGVRRDEFLEDLNEKTGVVLLEQQMDGIVGFSTLLLYEILFAGEPITVVYSGDTIVDRSCWGTLALHKCWIDTVNAIRRERSGKMYWLLISSGYRTYRFLPLFFKEYFPRFDMPTPPEVRVLMDALASERFGEDYYPESGIVRFSRSPQILRPGIGEISPKKLSDPHIAFFANRNPRHFRGDELVCLTEISLENLRPAGRRMAGLLARRQV